MKYPNNLLSENTPNKTHLALQKLIKNTNYLTELQNIDGIMSEHLFAPN